MRLRDTMGFRNIKAAAAGSQATHADSRASDEWIKNYLDKKNERLNNLRRELNHLLGPEKGEWQAAYREDKKFPEQNPGRVGGYGPWCVVTPEGEILSRWPSEAQARNAAWGMWRGLKSSTGPTAGARVEKIAADWNIFTDDPTEANKSRKNYRALKHPKPRIVRDADLIRMGDNRPSSNGQGAAGTGGAGAGGAGGGVGI